MNTHAHRLSTTARLLQLRTLSTLLGEVVPEDTESGDGPYHWTVIVAITMVSMAMLSMCTIWWLQRSETAAFESGFQNGTRASEEDTMSIDE